MVKSIASAYQLQLQVEMLCFPNYALEDHWNDGQLQKMMEKNRYDMIIVQQGPSSQQEGRTMLKEYGEKIKNLCVKTNSSLAFFTVWPARVNDQNFDGVITSYSEAARYTNAINCPAGRMWKTYMEQSSDYTLYGPDGFHPSGAGSTLAAMSIFYSLFPDQPVNDLSYQPIRAMGATETQFNRFKEVIQKNQ